VANSPIQYPGPKAPGETTASPPGTSPRRPARRLRLAAANDNRVPLTRRLVRIAKILPGLAFAGWLLWDFLR
jgi:hypothetical protein